MEVSMVPTNSTKPTNAPATAGADLDEIPRQVMQLAALDLAALRESWIAIFDSQPSSRLGRRFIIRALAYRLQERTFAVLKPSTRRLLERIFDAPAQATLKHVSQRPPGAGTVLIRQWRGVSHRVMVLEDEVVYLGRRYKSLSEVARLITGTRWSGPVFFGLERRDREVANG
jgi:hypothetical protein